MSNSVVKKNYSYNLIYQIFMIIVPILVTPYIARVIGEEGTGQYSFTLSIVTYFVLFASLGFNIYGQRLIARNQGDKKQQSTDFWEIILARTIPVISMLLILFALIFMNIFNSYTTLIIIQSIAILAVLFDVTFFFQGNEKFGNIVLRNIVIKAFSIGAIFIFVKNSEDLGVYVFIQCITILVSNISLWLYLPKMLDKVKIKDLNILKHFKPTLILFLPTIASSIYLSLDKTLIGIITGSDIENGNYEYAEKFIKLSMVFFTSLGAVMIPRNTKKFKDGDFEGLENNIYFTSRFVFLLGIPIAIGLFCIADNLMPWYLGHGYDKSSNIMKLLTPLVLIIGFSNVLGMQFLIPTGNDKKFTIAIIIGAVSNLALNLMLINLFASYGAAIATVIAEFLITFIMILYTRKKLSHKRIVLLSTKYIIAGLIMFIPCFLLGRSLESSIINTLLIFFVGCFTYSLCLIILRDKIFYEGLMKILKRGKK